MQSTGICILLKRPYDAYMFGRALETVDAMHNHHIEKDSPGPNDLDLYSRRDCTSGPDSFALPGSADQLESEAVWRT